MSNKARITIIIEDREDGSVNVECTPNLMEMVERTRRGPSARSMAVAYAMSALRHIAEESKAMKRASSRLILPPGIAS